MYKIEVALYRATSLFYDTNANGRNSMIKLVIAAIVIMALSNCKNQNNNAASKTADEMKGDSLRLVADSLAMMRNMHAMQTGVHIHNNGDLAAVAHQDPKKTDRIKRVERESRAARIANEKKRSESIQKAISDSQEN